MSSEESAFDMNDVFGGGASVPEKQEGKKEAPVDETSSQDTVSSKGDEKTQDDAPQSPTKQGADQLPSYNPFDTKKKAAEEPEEGSKDSVEDYKSRFEATRKEFLRASRQLADARKAIDTLEEEYDVNEETAKKLKSLVDFKPSVDDGWIDAKEEEPTIIQKVVSSVQGEIETFRKYSPVQDIDKFLKSFERWYRSDAAQAEREAADTVLEKYLEDPAALIKKVVEVGQTLYKDIYGAVEQSGGLYALIHQHHEVLAQKQAKIDELQKKVDNLKKKKETEDDHIPSSGYKLSSLKAPSKAEVDLLNGIWG